MACSTQQEDPNFTVHVLEMSVYLGRILYFHQLGGLQRVSEALGGRAADARWRRGSLCLHGYTTRLNDVVRGEYFSTSGISNCSHHYGLVSAERRAGFRMVMTPAAQLIEILASAAPT